MRFIPKQLFHKQEIAALLRAGENAVQNDHYKAAASAFEEAAALGSSEAMMQLARLCLTRTTSRIDPFAMIEKITQGSPVFPYDLACDFFPDDKAAIKWLSRAAELKNPEAACLLGCMLCEGIGCDANQEEGLRYLRLAMKYGSTDARKLLWLYQPDGTRLTDEAYEQKLMKFQSMLNARDDACYPLYSTLRSGTPRQLARLGYLLMTYQNNGDPYCRCFRTEVTEEGVPLIPAACRRLRWKTYVRIDWDSFLRPEPLLAVSSDIMSADEPHYFMEVKQHLEYVGTATYRSPEFGWLKAVKKAALFRYTPIRIAEFDRVALHWILQKQPLREWEYQDDVSFFLERGEKEYSVEIACISGNAVDILYRYTIGGSDDVEHYFPPELISLALL